MRLINVKTEHVHVIGTLAEWINGGLWGSWQMEATLGTTGQSLDPNCRIKVKFAQVPGYGDGRRTASCGTVWAA